MNDTQHCRHKFPDGDWCGRPCPCPTHDAIPADTKTADIRSVMDKISALVVEYDRLKAQALEIQAEQDEFGRQLDVLAQENSDLRVEASRLRAQVSMLEYRLADSQRNEVRANGRMTEMRDALTESSHDRVKLRRALAKIATAQGNTIQHAQGIARAALSKEKQ